jgi:hypothetical protein
MVTIAEGTAYSGGRVRTSDAISRRKSYVEVIQMARMERVFEHHLLLLVYPLIKCNDGVGRYLSAKDRLFGDSNSHHGDS